MYSPLSRRQYVPTVPRVGRYRNRLPVHLLRAAGFVMLGVAAVLVAVVVFPAWTAALLVAIAVPPGVLFGTVWVQLCRRYIHRLEQSLLPLEVVSLARRREPVLFWFGLVGMAVVCGGSYFLVLAPLQSQLQFWNGLQIGKELSVLFMVMVAVAEIAEVLFLYRLIGEQRRHRRVTEQLAYAFLEQYEYHKN